MKTNAKLIKIFGWITTLLIPLTILMLSVRILISPIFPKVEYRLPGFPEDPFGFTVEDRLHWSEPSIRYLVNNQDISYLEILQFDDGTPLFTDRELSHMEDVKEVVTGMRIGLAAAMFILLVITFIATRDGWRAEIIKAYYRGGVGIFGLVLGILFFVALNFSNLFTRFHQLFFESGTWLFYTSDTLIRLFPMRFWRDAFIFVGVLSLLMGVGLIWFAKKQEN